jgi:hypothetical protein
MLLAIEYRFDFWVVLSDNGICYILINKTFTCDRMRRVNGPDRRVCKSLERGGRGILSRSTECLSMGVWIEYRIYWPL